jgi:hypothetical protein
MLTPNRTAAAVYLYQLGVPLVNILYVRTKPEGEIPAKYPLTQATLLLVKIVKVPQ